MSPPKPASRLSASDVRRALSEAGKPINQVALQSLLELPKRDTRHLRTVLKGLIGSGEVELDAKGRFSLAKAQRGLTGVLRGERGQLFLDDEPVIDQQRRLRAGDEVHAVPTDGGVQVIEVLRHAEHPVVGILRRGRYHATVDSLSPGFRGRVTLSNDDSELRDGDTVEFRVTGDDGQGLIGRLVRRVVREGDADRASSTLLASHGVPTVFPEGVMQACDRLPKSVGPHRQRKDLSDLPFVTIDGEDARDFDDALYCERTRSGWELWVAIADVGHYVKRGSALDAEALVRGNSVYLADRVVPMLPEALSNDLCSLRPEERRLALVCRMRLGAKGTITQFSFFEAVIRSWARLTYTDVGAHFDGAALPVSVEVTDSLARLREAFGALQQARERRGGLDFESNEVKLELHRGKVIALHPVLRNDAHKLVEEAMIAANVCAARFIEDAEQGGLYRNHEPPEDAKREQMRQAFAMAGIRFEHDKVTPKNLAAAMAQLQDRPDRSVFEVLILRSLMQANYGPELKGHFGLGLTHYAHFTSPIRRYPDLIVHRIIKALIHGKSPRLSAEALQQFGEQCSMTERRAEDVERGVTTWLKCEYLAEHLGEAFDGVIAAVTHFGVFVELEPFYLQGLVHISNLGRDYYHYHAESQSLIGERNGQRFAMGDRLQVVLSSVEPEAGKIDLMPVSSRSQGRDGADKRGAKGKRSSTSGTRQGGKGGKRDKGSKGSKSSRSRKGAKRGGRRR